MRELTTAYIVSILLILLAIPACDHIVNSTPMTLQETTLLAENTSISELRVQEYIGGCPSDAVPFHDWLIVTFGDSIEVRTNSYDLVSSAELPLPTSEVVISNTGAIVVSLMPQGLCYLELDERGTLVLLDHLIEGQWEQLDIGNDFLCAWNIDDEQIQVIDIIDSQLKLGPTLIGNKFSVDSSCVISSNGYNTTFWNRSETDTPPAPYPFLIIPRWLELRGALVFWWQWNSWFEYDLHVGDVSNLTVDGRIRKVGMFHGLRATTVACSADYIYLKTRTLNGPYNHVGIVAIHISNPDNIRVAKVFDEILYSNIYDSRTSGNEYGFAAIGLNFLEWWNIEELHPTLIRVHNYLGYLTDVAIADGVYDPIVWDGYHTDVPDRREWGYPVVYPGNHPYLGDIADLVVLNGHSFNTYNSEISPLLTARLEPYLDSFDYRPHPTTEPEVYNQSFFNVRLESIGHRGYRNRLYRWTVNWTDLSIQKTRLLEIVDDDRPVYYLRTISDNYYLTVWRSSLLIINLDSLEQHKLDVEFPDDMLMIEYVDERMIILSSSGLSSYRLNIDLPETLDVDYLSHISLSADVFTINDDFVFVANSTHVEKIGIKNNGEFERLSSGLVPTKFLPNYYDETERTEPGDLIVDSYSGKIIRAAGFYGMCILDDFIVDNATITTTTLQEDVFQYPLLVGFTSGLVFTLLAPIVVIGIQRLRVNMFKKGVHERHDLKIIEDLKHGKSTENH